MLCVHADVTMAISARALPSLWLKTLMLLLFSSRNQKIWWLECPISDLKFQNFYSEFPMENPRGEMIRHLEPSWSQLPAQNGKTVRHWGFPRRHRAQYWPSSLPLSFRVLMGSGVFGRIWTNHAGMCDYRYMLCKQRCFIVMIMISSELLQ